MKIEQIYVFLAGGDGYDLIMVTYSGGGKGFKEEKRGRSCKHSKDIKFFVIINCSSNGGKSMMK